MLRKYSLLTTAVGLALLWFAEVLHAQPPALESFYIGRHFFSDDLSGWNKQVLEVIPRGDGVRVRLIRLSLANPFCDGVLVQAAERVIERTTVAKVAGLDLCTLDGAHVEAMLNRASPRAARSRTETAAATIVATCAARETVLSFPYDDSVDWKRLERSSPRVAQAGHLFDHVVDRTFGPRLTFDWGRPAQIHGFDTVGTTVVPDLVSGRFATVLDSAITDRLRDYTGPPSRHLLPADVLERGQLQLQRDAPIQFPAVALSARISGDVRFRLTVDRTTGAVTAVETVSGPTLLSEPTAATLGAWQFVPESVPDGHVELTVRFQPRCGG
jgi:hypothetical protein